MTTAVVVVAAGRGRRLGGGTPKALRLLGGRPLVVHAVEAARQVGQSVVVAAPPEAVAQFRELLGPGVTVTAGGETRQDSVRFALAELPGEVDVVLVHDAARALAPAALFRQVVEAVHRGAGAVVPGLPVTDTIKQVDAAEQVTATIDRARLRAVQTPQGFRRALLETAHAVAHAEGSTATDDAALLEAAGHPVLVVPGSEEAIKITYPEDFAVAEQLLAGREVGSAPADQQRGPALPRVGIGTDTHAFQAGRPCHLAGLFWPEEDGLAGHSDGDAVAHACADALFSAAGLEDLGAQFGVADPRWAGAGGTELLAEAARRVTSAGWSIGNIAVQAIGPRPKIGPRRREAERALSEAAGAPVTLSATTADGLGAMGRGEGLTAIATALVVRR